MWLSSFPDTYQPPSMELLQTKESALHEAMSLNEQLAKATKTKRDIQKQASVDQGTI